MDDKKLQKILSLCKDIESKEGEGSIFSLGSKKGSQGICRWSTNISDLDTILGGGFPKGRMVEIFGPESSGKTSLAYHLCGQAELCLFIPAEGTFDNERAVVFGNRPKQMLVYKKCKYAEDIMDKMMRFAKEGIPLIVVDSVPAMVPKAQYDLVEKDIEKQPQRGQLASFFSRTLKNLNDIIEVSGTTIIFINQVRDKMDAMMFGEKTSTPGGHALRHFASVRIQVGRKAWVEIPNKNPANSASEEKIGVISKFKVVKSKICNPFGECELPMIFDKGYVSFDDIPTIRKEKMKKSKRVDDDELEG